MQENGYFELILSQEPLPNGAYDTYYRILGEELPSFWTHAKVCCSRESKMTFGMHSRALGPQVIDP